MPDMDPEVVAQAAEDLDDFNHGGPHAVIPRVQAGQQAATMIRQLQKQVADLTTAETSRSTHRDGHGGPMKSDQLDTSPAAVEATVKQLNDLAVELRADADEWTMRPTPGVLIDAAILLRSLLRERDDLQIALADAHNALANVKMALFDASNVSLPANATRYGQAIRTALADRDATITALRSEREATDASSR